MFVRQNQQQFRNSNADVQIYYGTETNKQTKSWNKPTGVSHVYMLLIGAGGDGDATNGGGSGAVTVWYGAAQNVPDVLAINAGISGAATSVVMRGSSSTTLLTAGQASGVSGAAAMTANQFAASGFFKSVAGQNGSGSSVSASTTTFLSGGGSSGPVTANYGYGIVAPSNDGFLQLQPIAVGVGGINTKNGGIGCGGGASGLGGSGMVLIASW